MDRTSRWCAVAILLCGGGVIRAADDVRPTDPAVEISVGDAAPGFKGVDDRGEAWDSAQHVGKGYVVFYFYPADFTTGCSKQAESFRDTMNDLVERGIKVVGVSGDVVKNHQLFKDSWKLNYTLLADESGAIAAKFGVPAKAGGQVMPYGPDRKPLTNEKGDRFRIERKATFARWTFVIGPSGKVLYKNTNVIPANDAKQVLEFIEKHQREAKTATID